MLRNLLIVGVFVALTGGAMAETITLPSGQTASKTVCKSNSMDCLREASATCGGSYQVLDSESHAGGLLADWMAGPVTWYSMLYACGASDGRMPTFEFRGPTYQPPRFASCSMMGQSVYCWSH